MPYKNGKIYSSVDADGNKIGINTDDIYAVTGEPSHDTGTLGRSSKVNKWNKNKPYRRTSPEIPSRTVHNGSDPNNGSGMYSGIRGAATGFPVYWGLKYPMNTKQQNPSGGERNNLLEICYYVATRAIGIPYPNFVYVKPVVDVDFCSEDDFDGYSQNYGPFLEAGVAGATNGNNSVATLKMNKFNNASLTIYANLGHENPDFTFRDLIPEASSYYLVAEFYQWAIWDENIVKQNAAPFLVVSSAVSFDTDNRSLTIEVPLSTVWQQGGYGNSTNMNFYVCVGFNKKSGSSWAYQSAFVAPWTGDGRCATKVSVTQASPYSVELLKYAWATGSTYNNFPTSVVPAQSDTMRFQTKITNNGTDTLQIFAGATTAPVGALKFRAKAVGGYGEYHNSNSGHTSAGGDDSNGKWCLLEIATAANMSSTVNSISVAPNGGSTTLYMRANSLLPYGHTTGIIIEVSNDNGASWATTGMKVAYFDRLNA